MATRRAVTVAPERLELWLARFAHDHGELAWEFAGATATATATDRVVARCTIPFPPLATGDSLIDHALRDRTIGVLLVRLGGFAAGIFEGRALVASKCGRRAVHGRNSAGGSSQQRFARRRENQVGVALDAAAATAASVLVPALGELEAVVTGGDRRAVARVLEDPRLAGLAKRVAGPFLTVPDPRRAVLIAAGDQARLVHIDVADMR